MRRFLGSGSAVLSLALFESFQEWLRSFTPDSGGLAGLWEEEGSIMDPDG